jgi:peptidoglycan/LPS O-acetylase OafA/YrhL
VPEVPDVPSVPDVLGVPDALSVPDAPSKARTSGTESTTGTLRRRPQLDGLRAAAVAVVAWSHWERDYQFGIPFGAGVHLFFVLSGFLITTILLDIRSAADRWAAVRSFYIRRALRIFPAFYLTLLLAWLGNVPFVRESLTWQLSYLSNVWIFFVADHWPGSISHLWSLAVEEQFYLAWPWLIVFAPRRWLVPGIVGCIAIAPAFRWLLAEGGHRESMLTVLTPGCLDSLGMGALIAVARTKPGPTSPGMNVGLGFSPAIALASLCFIGLVVFDASGSMLPLPLMAIKQTLQAVVFGWIVMRAAQGFEGHAGRMLSAPALVYLGQISYGIYLAHGFAGEILATLGLSGASLPEPLRFVALAGVTVGAASLSWHLMERRINALKAHVPYRTPSIA